MNIHSHSLTDRLRSTAAIAWAVMVGALLVLAAGGDTPVYAQGTSNPAMDLVFLVDESGSMYDDAAEVNARITDLVRELKSEVDVRVSLIGFGAFVGHFGTTAAGQAHIHTPLVSEARVFQEALDQLVSNGGVEPGFSAVALGMSDAVRFRPEAGVCAVLITDEDADVTPEAPETKADALAALQRRNAVLLAIVDPGHGSTADDYGPNPGSLAEATGGAVFNILDFRADPTTVLATVLRTCVRITTGREAPVEPPRSEEPRDMILETLKSLQERLERLSPTIAALLEQVGENGGKLRRLEMQRATWTEEIASLRTTMEELAGRMDALAQQRMAVPPEPEARLTALRQDLSSLQATVAHLADQQQVFVNQFGDLTNRMRSLEQRIAALPSEVETNISRQFVAFFQKIQTESNQRITQLEERWLAESGALRQGLTSLQATVADLVQARRTAASRLDDVARRVEALERDVKEHVTTVAARIDAIEQREDELQAQVDGADGDIAALREIVDGLAVEHGDFADMIGAVAEHVDALDGRLAEIVPDLEARLDELQALGLENQAENRRLAERVAALEQMLSMLQGAVTQNAQAIQALRELTDRLAQMKDALRETNDALSARINELAGRISANEDAIAALHAGLADALGGLRGELGQLRGDLDALVAQLEGRLSALSARMAELEQALSEAAKADDVEGALSEIRGQLADLAARQREIQAQLAQIRALAEGNRGAISELQPSRERLKEELKREILGELPKAPEVITREQAQPDAAFRLAVVALLVSIAAVAIAFLV
jgi:predicted  nucleic acid-binding Zn-ribbon protein